MHLFLFSTISCFKLLSRFGKQCLSTNGDILFDLRPEGVSFYDSWLEIELEREGVVTLDSLSLISCSQTLEHRSSYIQSFPDVEHIFLDLEPIEDIVEPILHLSEQEIIIYMMLLSPSHF